MICKFIIFILSLLINFGILFLFKYCNFFVENINRLNTLLGSSSKFRSPDFLLPVGISFYTFQAVGYTIDIYRGNIKAERNFITYALFVTFFPQLVAGPIERSENLLPQFKTIHSFDEEDATDGLKLCFFGLIKKCIFADFLALYVDTAYNKISEASGLALLIATLFFAFQIYCDFSGYTDIAIGVAKVLGFNLTKNFSSPYASCSVKEFWNRWHISLGSWFRDYVYIPLGGSRVIKIRHYFNLLITFLISGFWHGAAFHFIAWGFLLGIFLIAENILNNIHEKIPLYIKVFLTFVIVCFAWIFFRAPSLTSAITISKKVLISPKEFFGILIGLSTKTLSFGEGFFESITLGFSKAKLFLFFTICALLATVQSYFKDKSILYFFNKQCGFIRWTLYIIFGTMITVYFLLHTTLESSQFIYFQF